VFRTQAIPIWVWPVLAGGAFGLLLAEELRKLARRRWKSFATGDRGRRPRHEPPHPHALV
jgi:hypothetical protein